MAVSSHAASELLTGSIENVPEMSDSEDCQSDDENDFKEDSVIFQNDVEQENNYKMKEVQSRAYQIELLERAKTENIIICLPTGSGKTYIALELTKHMLPDAIKNQQKIIFVANSRPLVNQQAKYFSQNLSSTVLQDDNVVRAITGDLNFDAWKKEQWDEALAERHILVATTQIIVDAMARHFIKWSQIALLILDECHHAQKGHVMAQLMKLYVAHQMDNGLSSQSEIGSKGVPRILGLTATIISTGRSEAEFIERDIKQIENTLCCKAYTHKNYEDVLKYSTSALLESRPFTSTYKRTDYLCDDITQLVELLTRFPKNFGEPNEISIIERVSHPSLTSEEQIYDKNKGVPEKVSSFLTDLLLTYEELGPYCCKIAARLKIYHLIQWIEKLQCQTYIGHHDINLKSDPCEELEPSILMLLEAAKTTLFQFIKKLDDWMNQFVKDIISKETPKKMTLDPEIYKLRHCVSNKIEVLWETLAERKPKQASEPTKENRLCGIIFCKKRITALVIRWYLKEAGEVELLDFIKPEVMLGQSTVVGDVELARFSAKRQEDILKRFKKGDLNLLVSTQVLEEGIDVPACNLVVRFDRIENYPSFVQSLGRARIKLAQCYALIDKEDWDEQKNRLDKFDEYNKKLAAVLEHKANHVGENDGTEIMELEKFLEDIIPPFKPIDNPNGSMVTAMEAISLVYKYCDGLSCDRIATLAPVSWNEEEVVGNGKRFKARVMLPILSPVREVVEGEWMPNKTLAKRSAFLKCYVRLWEEEELDEYLLPKRRTIEDFRCDFLDDLQNELEGEMRAAVGKIGTKKRKQWYRKKEPSIFLEIDPIEGNPMPLVYKIDIQLSKFTGDKSIEHLYKFDNYGLCFGIVTNARLDGLPPFTLKAHFGILKVSLEKLKLNQETFSSDQFEGLEKFQEFLSSFVFDIQAWIFERDPLKPIMIAPLKTGTSNEIDWTLIRDILDMEKDPNKIFTQPSRESRFNMKFDPNDYVNKLLVPWYKKGTELYCTLSVTDLDARSAFPHSKYSTFEKYFNEEYNVEIIHPKFPLIHYKAIGTNLNFLKKRPDSDEMRKEMRSRSLMIIPELVNIHVLPASLFVQGKFLPSVLHRIHRLLIANELRKKVAEYFDWDVDSGSNEEINFIEHDILDSNISGFEQLSISKINKEQNNFGAKVDGKRERNIVLLETINPNSMDWETINRFDSMSIRVAKYALPDPPTYKSNVCDNLIDIKTVKSYHFDQKTDFTVEKVPSMETIMEALTLSNPNDHVSLEKLEVMGDSVLKLIASLHIFHSFPSWDEGKMTQLRTKLISNLHLYQIGKKHELGELLSGSIFVPKESWLPSGFTIPKNSENWFLVDELENKGQIEDIKLQNITSDYTTYTHSRVGNKSVADCVEALIGAYFINGGLDGSFRIMDYLGMRGPLEDGRAEIYSRESTVPSLEPTPISNASNLNFPMAFVEDLEKVLQYEFKNKWIVLEALTHPTFMGNIDTRCYERLEFVGDAILDFLVTNYVLKETKISDPGKITDLRMALVNNVTFACLTVRYGLHKFLRYHSEHLKYFIDQFVMYQEENNHQVSDPYKLLSDFDCPAVQEIDVPKVLGDLFESIAGAVFVDSGNSIDTVWAVFCRLMKNELETFSKIIPKAPLRKLYEEFPGKVKFTKPSSSNNKNLQEKDTAQSHFKVVKLKVPKSPSVFGVGTTIKQAKIAAAKYLVRKLNIK